MKALCAILLVFSLGACAVPQRTAPPPTNAQWTTANVTGLSIELVDPVSIESMSFTPDGLVPLTAGKKGGPLMGPLFYWQLVSGRLRITLDGQRLYDEFTLVARDTRTLTVRRHNGQIAKYKILRQ